MSSMARLIALAVFALGHCSAQTSSAGSITNCEDLVTAVQSADSSITITIGGDFAQGCAENIAIGSAKEIEVNGNGYQIPLALGLATNSDEKALFSNSGTLVLRNIVFTDEDDSVTEESGVRVVWNTGVLNVEGCTFTDIGLRDTDYRLDNGGAIHTTGATMISDSTFTNIGASQYGGAIYAGGSIDLEVVSSSFKGNELEDGDIGVSMGGDIYAEDGVALTLQYSNFSGSEANYAAASVKCCGATIEGCTFTNIEVSHAAENMGALTSGTPSGEECPNKLEIFDTTFSRCKSNGNGQGGALAIYDTYAVLENVIVGESEKSALVFVSSNGGDPHTLQLTNVQFNENTDPSVTYYATDGSEQGAALVISNTGLSEDDEPVEMGYFDGVYCFGNEPYECEFVYDNVEVVHMSEFKCQVCDMEGERQYVELEDEEVEEIAEDRGIDTGTDDSSEGLVIGLSVALGLTLVVIGALAAYKIRVRKNARRLMEDMGEQDI